ncbi:MAG: hypothetical protein H0U85_01470 [Gemmatimonadales bacterium]|nr:hypothetical protein [Gemmatimonadales bacterium]
MPDTVRASFSAQYRVTVQLVNALPGSVATAAAPPGSDLDAGVFVPGGTPITLTATAPEGTFFGGWSGDTTSSSPALTLPMARAYSVRATFLSQVAVTVNAAADALLGRSSLTAEQASYLDSRGNRNGTFDLGDFLAFARAQGISPRAAVMQQVLSKTMGKAP